MTNDVNGRTNVKTASNDLEEQWNLFPTDTDN